MSWKDPIPYHQVERDPSKADLVSPGLLGIPTTTTPVLGIRSEQIANSQFVIDSISNAGALLTSGDQDWTGIKRATNVGAGIRTGVKLINNQTSGVGAMLDIENNGSFGQLIYSTRGVGLSITSLGARGIQLSALAGEALHSSSKSGANNVVLHNTTGSGANIIASQGFQANGLNFVGQNAGITTFSVDKYGDVIARYIKAEPAILATHVVVKAQLDLKADIISPIFSGIPKAPTALPGTATEQIATTAFVMLATTVDQVIIQNSSRAVSGGAVYQALSDKQDSLGYTPENISNKNIALGYVGLEADSKINPIYLPAIPLADVRPVPSESAMLALPSISGTVAIRSDISKTFILQGGSASTIGNWLELLSPTQGVQSVFGRPGTVVASYGDYSTDLVTEGVNLYYTEQRVSANVDVVANTLDRHKALTIDVANGLNLNEATQKLSLGVATAFTSGALSNADWARFNSKQDFIVNPITGSLTAGHLVRSLSANTVASSTITEDSEGVIGMSSLVIANVIKTLPFFVSGGGAIFGISLGTDALGVPILQGTDKDGAGMQSISMQPSGGAVLIGTNLARSEGLLQVAGTITAFAGTEQGEVVIRQQLDTKLDKDLSILPEVTQLTGEEKIVVEQEGTAKLLDISTLTTGSGGMETVSMVIDKSLSDLGLAEDATDTQIEGKFQELLVTLPATTYIGTTEYSTLYVFRLIEI